MADQDGEIDIEIGEDAAWVAAALVLVAVLGGAVVLSEWPLWGVDVQQSDGPGEPNLVEPAENGTVLWPYTSKRTTYGSKTLGINMVFFGDPADVRTALTHSERKPTASAVGVSAITAEWTASSNRW